MLSPKVEFTMSYGHTKKTYEWTNHDDGNLTSYKKIKLTIYSQCFEDE